MLKSTAYIGVKIENGPNAGASGIGTASLVDKKNRLLLTNQHVAQLASQGALFVVFPMYDNKGVLVVEKKAYNEALKSPKFAIPGYVEYQDKKADLALIRLAGLPDGVLPISLAQQSAVRGQIMYALANTLWPAALTAWTMYSGQARGFPHDQKWISDNRQGQKGVERESKVIECQSFIYPGDSGGPVVNDRGELIAVTIGDANLLNLFIDVEEVKKFLARYCESKRPRAKRPPPSQISPSRNTELLKGLNKKP